MEEWAALRVEDINDIRCRLPNLPTHCTTVPLLLQILIESNMVQNSDDEEESPSALTMILPAEVAEAGARHEDHSEDDDDEDAQGGAVDTSEGSVLAPDRAEALMPESEQDCQPWKGPGLGTEATASRRIQTGTSLTYPGNEKGVFLGELCDGTSTAGGQIVRKGVVSCHTTVNSAPGVGLGIRWEHSRRMVGGWTLGELISGCHLTAAWGKGVQALSEPASAPTKTHQMTDQASEEFFYWKGQYEDLPQWKCQCCDILQHTCPITQEEYSFCSKSCAEEYMHYHQYRSVRPPSHKARESSNTRFQVKR
eukprot:2354296-Rhodomonas_salina.2